MTIKEMRTAMGLSQTAFGNHFGIPMRSIQNWESGERNPPEYVVKLIEMNLRLANKVTQLEKQIEEQRKI